MNAPQTIRNAFTVDVEDYFQVSALAPYIARARASSRSVPLVVSWRASEVPVALARSLARVAMAALPLAFGRLAGALPLTVTMGAGIAMTGFVGFCPACYLVGRKLEAR